MYTSLDHVTNCFADVVAIIFEDIHFSANSIMQFSQGLWDVTYTMLWDTLGKQICLFMQRHDAAKVIESDNERMKVNQQIFCTPNSKLWCWIMQLSERRILKLWAGLSDVLREILSYEGFLRHKFYLILRNFEWVSSFNNIIKCIPNRARCILIHSFLELKSILQSPS